MQKSTGRSRTPLIHEAARRGFIDQERGGLKNRSSQIRRQRVKPAPNEPKTLAPSCKQASLLFPTTAVGRRRRAHNISTAAFKFPVREGAAGQGEARLLRASSIDQRHVDRPMHPCRFRSAAILWTKPHTTPRPPSAGVEPRLRGRDWFLRCGDNHRSTRRLGAPKVWIDPSPDFVFPFLFSAPQPDQISIRLGCVCMYMFACTPCPVRRPQPDPPHSYTILFMIGPSTKPAQTPLSPSLPPIVSFRPAQPMRALVLINSCCRFAAQPRGDGRIKCAWSCVIVSFSP